MVAVRPHGVHLQFHSMHRYGADAERLRSWVSAQGMLSSDTLIWRRWGLIVASRNFLSIFLRDFCQAAAPGSGALAGRPCTFIGISLDFSIVLRTLDPNRSINYNRIKASLMSCFGSYNKS
jgi:hypothetical protein